MSSTNNNAKRIRGPNYSKEEDIVIMEILLQHSHEVGMFDKNNYSWDTRFKQYSVSNDLTDY